MSSVENLLQFHFEQEEYIKENADNLRKQGYVKGYKDVYPDIYDRIYSQKGVAYIRGSVPLKLMVLLYDVVIVYIPPLTQSQLEKRFKLKWNDFIKLCQQGLIIPIIGNAINYGKNHFNELFSLPSPPYSLWARGLALLDVFNMSNALDVAKEVLPVDDIASDTRIFSTWKKSTNLDDEEVKKKIKDDVAVLYADLCIFGCKNEADVLTCLPPNKIYNTLKIMNEIKTYPILFGLESQANYDYDKLKMISKINIRRPDFVPLAVPEKELEILFNGIGINIDNLEVENIIKYHIDGLGQKLRMALSSFNGYCDEKIKKSAPLEMTEVFSKAEAFQSDLKLALRELDSRKYSALDATYNSLTTILKIGTVAIGSALAFNENSSDLFSVISAIGTGASIIASVPEEVAELVTKMSAQRQSKFVSNMWAAKRIVGG